MKRADLLNERMLHLEKISHVFCEGQWLRWSNDQYRNATFVCAYACTHKCRAFAIDDDGILEIITIVSQECHMVSRID